MKTRDKNALLALVLILALAFAVASTSKGQLFSLTPPKATGCAKFINIRPHAVEFCTAYRPAAAESAAWAQYAPLDSVIITGGAGVTVVVDGKVVWHAGK